jgi:large subunit ribosomal protein L25
MATLHAQARSAGKANALRRDGKIPAVLYGPTIESQALAVDARELRALFAKVTRSTRIDLAIGENGDEKTFDVFVKAIQYDPITDNPVHVDFYHPDTGHPLRLYVPIKVTGEAKGVKAGGVLNVIFRTVRVHGLPKDIPALLTVDVTDLDLHDAVRVRDLDFGEVEPLLPPERTLVTVLAPRGIEVVEEEELEEGELVAAEGEEAAEGEAPDAESAAEDDASGDEGDTG